MADENDSQKQPLEVSSVIAVMLDQMVSIAWQKLGLQHDVMTGKIEKDVNQAKLAIDVASSLGQFLEPVLDEDDKRQVQNILRDLKVNFVEQSKGVSS